MTHRWLNTLFAAAALALVLISCAPAAGPAGGSRAVVLTCADFENQANEVRSVDIAVGDAVTVTLCSNKTTGFSWTENAQIGDPQVIQQSDYKWIAPGNTGRVGAAGDEVWTFKGLKPGASSAYLEYSQPWAGGEKAARTFKLNVTVR